MTRKTAARRHRCAQLVELEAVTDADAPVVGRFAVDSDAKDENGKTAQRSSEALMAKLDTVLPGTSPIWRGPEV